MEGKCRTLRYTECFFLYLPLFSLGTHSPHTPPPPSTEEIAVAFAGSQGEPVASLLLCNTRALHKLRSAN